MFLSKFINDLRCSSLLIILLIDFDRFTINAQQVIDEKTNFLKSKGYITYFIVEFGFFFLLFICIGLLISYLFRNNSNLKNLKFANSLNTLQENASDSISNRLNAEETLTDGSIDNLKVKKLKSTNDHSLTSSSRQTVIIPNEFHNS